MTLQIGIYIFDNVEVLDFAGPYEVFTCATRVAGGSEPRFSVFTLGEKRASVRARAGLKIDPDYALDDHPALDCLIVPGGLVTAEMEKPEVIDRLGLLAKSCKQPLLHLFALVFFCSQKPGYLTTVR